MSLKFCNMNPNICHLIVAILKSFSNTRKIFDVKHALVCILPIKLQSKSSLKFKKNQILTDNVTVCHKMAILTQYETAYLANLSVFIAQRP